MLKAVNVLFFFQASIHIRILVLLENYSIENLFWWKFAHVDFYALIARSVAHFIFVCVVLLRYGKSRSTLSMRMNIRFMMSPYERFRHISHFIFFNVFDCTGALVFKWGFFLRFHQIAQWWPAALRATPAVTRLTVHCRSQVDFCKLFCYSFRLRQSRGASRHPEASWNVSIDVIWRLNELEKVYRLTLEKCDF